MKTNLRNLISLVFIASLCACSSDDDTATPNATPDGAWQLTSLSIETAFDFNGDGIATPNLFEETPCYEGDFVTFDNEGGARVVSALTFISAEVNSPTDFEYVYECLDGFDIESTYTQDGNTVTIVFGGNNLVGTISGNTMTVNIPDFFEIELYDGTNFVDVEEDTVLVYVKE